MVDRPPDADSAERTDAYAGTPRWVKVFGSIAVVVLLLLAFILFSGLGGPHGPQRHGAAVEQLVGQAGIVGQITSV